MNFLDYAVLLIVLLVVVGFVTYGRISSVAMVRSQLDLHREREKAIKGHYDKPEHDSSDDDQA
ncbi:hypothetical protein [Devosia sp. FKR38]|uniref:hypothetical protein n=1 Tax=Devosia sp. FKR38 TaxID=2562312 RepID=UPI0010C0AC91|nr:hypothetical protein [Devosia sp. FKR38]